MGERACAPISTDDPWRGLCGISLGEGQGFRGLFLLNLHFVSEEILLLTARGSSHAHIVSTEGVTIVIESR